MLRQLAPRGGRGGGGSSGNTPAVGYGGAGGAPGRGGGAGGEGRAKTDHTPRPGDLGSMVPAAHAFAPREGELAGMEEPHVLPVPAGSGRHYLSGEV
jgi:hypothetical protein